MTWRANTGPRQTFERNALTLVVFELRFNPVLLITKGTHVPELQDALRSEFPGFQTQETMTLAFAPQKRNDGNPPFVITRDRVFRFMSAERNVTVTVNSRQLAIECRHYTKRENFFPSVETAVSALRKFYSPIEVVRTGLRYQNVVSSATLSKDLNRTVTENEIFSAEFLRAHANLADMTGTTFTTEIRSPVPAPGFGAMALRYGIMQSNDGPNCNIDMDRYIEGIDPEQLDDLPMLLTKFADDISTLFRAASGPAWREWMKPIGVG